MNLQDYDTQITEIVASTELTPEEKRRALEMTAYEISSCAWQSHAQRGAEDLAERARAEAERFPVGDSLRAMDGLASKGLLARR